MGSTQGFVSGSLLPGRRRRFSWRVGSTGPGKASTVLSRVKGRSFCRVFFTGPPRFSFVRLGDGLMVKRLMKVITVQKSARV